MSVSRLGVSHKSQDSYQDELQNKAVQHGSWRCALEWHKCTAIAFLHWPMKNGSCHPLENWFKYIFVTLLLLEIFLTLKRQFFNYHLCDVSNCVSSKAITCAIRQRYLDNKHLKSFNNILFFSNFLGKQTIKSFALYR